MMNKKGQLDYPIITFVVIVFGLILLGPIMLKVFSSIQAPFNDALLNQTDGGVAAAAGFNKVMDTATNFWDKVLVAAFVLSLLLLFISAFLIDTHPVWIILYIFISFMLVMFAPDIVGTLSNIYESPLFVDEVNNLTFFSTILSHFGEFLVGIIVVTGIIIYGKVKYFGSGGGVRR